MNWPLFLLHIFLMISFVLGALRLGKQALVTLIAISAVLANLFVVKQIDLFGLTVTCGDVFAISAILSLNLLQEHFGKEAAKKGMEVSFFTLLFFACMVFLHLKYIPSSVDTAHPSFLHIFSSTPRIIGASFAVYYVVQKWDIYFFQWLQGHFKGNYLTTRLSISLLLSQAIDTILFSFLGLYGIVDSIFDIMVMSYLIKCFIISISAPVAVFSKRWIRIGVA